jgi:hypothetical protein
MYELIIILMVYHIIDLLPRLFVFFYDFKYIVLDSFSK